MLEIIGLAFLITLCVFFFVGVLFCIIGLILKIKNEYIADIVRFVFLFLLIFTIMIFAVWSSGLV